MENVITKNKTRLEHLEGVINRNLQSFYEVGRALMEIRDRGYYKDVLGYNTFEQYCKERWDFARRTAYQFIDSVKVIDNVRNCAQTPINESQTRPLARLEPEQQKEVWQKAVETAPDGKVTAKHITEVVMEVTGEKEIVYQDSDVVFQLKRWWRKATNKDKKVFIEWSKNK
jgi:hypothetical protein